MRSDAGSATAIACGLSSMNARTGFSHAVWRIGSATSGAMSIAVTTRQAANARGTAFRSSLQARASIPGVETTEWTVSARASVT